MNKHKIIKEILEAPLRNGKDQDDTIIIDTPELFQVINPSLKDPSKNEIILCQFDNVSAEALFNEKYREYESRGLSFKWCWNPLTRPKELEEILISRCSQHWSYWGMAARPLDIMIEYHEGISLKYVGLKDLCLYIDVYANGWGLNQEMKEKIYKKIEYDLKKNKRHLFIAFYNGIPAGTADFLKKKNCAYFGGAVVLPEFRSKGLYKGLVAERVKKLIEMDIDLVVTQARAHTSGPILQKVGFQAYFKENIYQFDIS